MDILGWIDTAQEYEPLIKTGIAALGTYASYQDQKKKNEMQQAAYDDYMRQVESAGQQARAAIDINYTPMVVSGVPTTKADVTDFTAVAARGGLMSIPNKQRKRYARGPEEFEVQEMDEEVFSPGDFKMETGVDVLGEQVFYDTGKGDRSNAMQIWGNMDTPDKAIFDFDFEIFFMDGSWRDMIKSEVEVGTETQMASAVDPEDALNDMSIEVFKGRQLHELTPEERQMLIDMANEQAAAPAAEGIMQAANGGRIGYNRGLVVNPGGYAGETAAPLDNKIEGFNEQMLSEYLQGNYPEYEGERVSDYYNRPNFTDVQAVVKIIQMGGSHDDVRKVLGIDITDERIDDFVRWNTEEKAHGGRIKKDNGGIMNLGGLEKDYRTTGGFVPIGAYEKKDDVPARLSKNEFVRTADAVRAAGGGSINKGAQLMYDTMKHLEAQPQAKRMTA